MFKKLSKLSILTLLISSFLFVNAFAGDLSKSRANFAAFKKEAPKVNRTLTAQAVAKYSGHSKEMAPAVRQHKKDHSDLVDKSNKHKKTILALGTTSSKDFSAGYKQRAKRQDRIYKASKKRFNQAAQDIIKAADFEVKSLKGQIKNIKAASASDFDNADRAARETDDGLLGN